MKAVKVLISDIVLDRATQPRVELDDETIQRYRDIVKAALDEGTSADKVTSILPPIDLFRDGPYLIMSDGRHRTAAFRAEGCEYVDALIYEGTERDAFLHALERNKTHGKSLTREDKINAIKQLLADDEWKTASVNWIAQTVGVDHRVAQNVIDSLGQNGQARKGKDGKVRKARKKVKKPDREPGDDTEEEKQEAKKGRPGKELVNFPKTRSVFGGLARRLTAIGNVYRAERKTEDFKVCRDALSTFAKAFGKIQARLEKEKA